MAEPSQRGVALLVVLLAIALLTVIVLEFTYRAQVEYRRAVAWVRVRQARLIADSGVAIAAEMLARAPLLYSLQRSGDPKTADGLTELWAQRCEEPGPHVCPANTLRSCALDTFDAHRLGLRIRDETGYYNMNRLVRESAAERGRFGSLITRLGLPPSLLDGVLQWTSRDSRGASVPHSTGLGGTTDGTYPVRAGPLATFGELGFVPGVRAADLIELRRLATVFDPSVGEININTAPLAVLAVLHPDLADETFLSQLHTARCERPFSDETSMRAALGSTRRFPFESLVTFKSELFRVEAVGNVDDFYQSVEAVLRRPHDADNRTEWAVELVYYLARRGSLIDPVMMQGPSALSEFTGDAPSLGGLP